MAAARRSMLMGLASAALLSAGFARGFLMMWCPFVMLLTPWQLVCSCCLLSPSTSCKHYVLQACCSLMQSATVTNVARSWRYAKQEVRHALTNEPSEYPKSATCSKHT